MMKREQFEQAMNAMLKRQPFRPFVIEMDHGEQFVVGQPEAVHHHAGSALYFHPNEAFDFVDPENVKQLLELEPVPPK